MGRLVGSRVLPRMAGALILHVRLASNVDPVDRSLSIALPSLPFDGSVGTIGLAGSSLVGSTSH
jgi:hypothetical protein